MIYPAPYDDDKDPERRDGPDDRRAVLTSIDRLHLILILTPLTLLSIASVIVALWLFIQPPIPTVRYGDIVSPTTPPSLCPGDFLTVVVPIDIKTEGALIVIGQSWIYADTSRRVWTEPVEWVPTLSSASPAFTFTVQVPWTDSIGNLLPPGEYEYRRGAQELRADGSILRVPFVIPKGCT